MEEAPRPRVGLVTARLSGLGGLFVSFSRHVKLLANDLTILPIALEQSKNPNDWSGRIERATCASGPAYRVTASDFAGDGLVDDQRQRAYVDALVRIAEDEKLDAFHVFGAFEKRPLVTAFAALLTELPLMISFRGSDLDVRTFGYQLPHLRTAVGTARLCVCVNQTAGKLVRDLFQPRGAVHVVQNHVDPENFSGEPMELPCPPPIIGITGEFRRVTGLDLLLRAFDEVAARRQVSLLLTGPMRKSESSYYRSIIQGMQCRERVFHIGPVEHSRILRVLETCDVLAFPSTSDGCPNKVLEAMLAGKPVIASRAGGIPELIDHGEEGLLVDPRNTSELVAALETLLDDSALRARLGSAGRSRVLREFTAERARTAWLEAYRQAGMAC